MKRRPVSPFLSDLTRIYRAAADPSDGSKCAVAPHPDLQAKIKAELEGLKAGASDLTRASLGLRQIPRVGFNDGLTVPGDTLPLGTPPSVARAVALDRAPLRGNVRVIVVLADFSDLQMAATQQHFRDLFFSTGVLPNGSVRDYFTEVTNGLVTLTGDVVGPLRLPRTLAAYANGASGTGGSHPNAQDMALDAAVAANPLVNFAPFDNDGNGFVDAFIVIHAGPGAEVTGSAGHIWSHKWVLPGGAYNADGTQIYAYLTVPEDCRIGVCAHELGHLLFGWPDLYDTDYSSEGLGNWCLMAGGSWNGGGDVPAHPSAWCKVNQGWVSVSNPTTNQQVSIQDVKAGHQVLRLWKSGGASSEYFLVENRQRTLYDRNLPGDGLLVFHVDDTISANSNEAHPKVALLQADGAKHLENGANRGDAGDPFPGSANNATFNKASTPSSKSYAGADTCVAITQISPSAATMTARISVVCLKKREKELVKEKPEKDVIKEKPEKDLIKDKREKDFLKDKREKDFKDIKEWKEKDKDRFEKPPSEKLVDKPGEGGGGGRSGGAPQGDLESRVAALEGALAGLEPFIGRELRPDLGAAALEYENDLEDVRAQMLEGAVGAKRLMDTKPPDR